MPENDQEAAEAENDCAETKPSPLSLRRKIQFTAASFVIALFLAEFGLRRWNASHHRVPSFVAVEDRIPFEPHPYIGFALKRSFNPPADGSYPIAHTNRLGFPGPEIAEVKPSGVRRIVCIGGSVTFGAGVGALADTYPRQLEKLLRERSGDHRIEVINAGVPYYTTAESLINYSLRLADLSPDAVVIYHGLNDRIPMMFQGFRGDYSHLRRSWATPTGRLRSLLRIIESSQLIAELDSFICERKASDGDLGNYIFYPLGQVKLIGSSQGDKLSTDGYRVFRRNLENLVTLAQKDGAAVFLHTIATRPEFKRGLFNRQSIETNNGSIRALSTKLALGLIDNDLPLSRPELFSDNIHYNQAGQRLLAERTAAAILSSPSFQRPPRPAVQSSGD